MCYLTVPVIYLDFYSQFIDALRTSSPTNHPWLQWIGKEGKRKGTL